MVSTWPTREAIGSVLLNDPSANYRTGVLSSNKVCSLPTAKSNGKASPPGQRSMLK